MKDMNDELIKIALSLDALQDDLKSYNELEKRIAELERHRSFLKGAFIVIAAIGGILASLFVEFFKGKI
jgi:hypothetical protein